MGTAAKRTRENRTITVDFRDDATYLQLLGDGKAFVEFVCAFLLSLGFQLAHKATCRGAGCLTPSHYARVRLGGLTIWRISAPPVVRCSPSCPISSCVIARYDPRSRALPLGTRGPQFGTLCGALSYFPVGPLSSHLCVWPPESGASADPVWVAAPGVFLGG